MLRYLWAKTAIALLGFSLWGNVSVMAETVVEKVVRTGKLTAGTSKDALPFAYRNAEGELVGYSIDLLKLITEQLEEEYVPLAAMLLILVRYRDCILLLVVR